MKFSTICLLGIITSIPFGIGFLLSPELTSAAYGVTDWTEGTAAVGRLLGVHLLYTGGANFAVWNCNDASVQRRYSRLFCGVSMLGTFVAMHAAFRPGAPLLVWSAVATYAFFFFAWGWFAFTPVDKARR